MSPDRPEDQIVELLIEHEKAVSALYESFSRRFPEEQAFWQRLSEEAVLHVNMISRLHIRIQAGEGIVRADRFDRHALEGSLTRIRTLLETPETSGYRLIDALETADSIEQSLLEHHYYDIFEGHTLEIKQIQYFLSDALKNHHERLAERLADIP
jgi:hypothetical protein